MAQIPTPRSYSEILGDMIDAFLSRYGIPALKVGSPVLSMFESSAQSQLRSSEDIFTLLEAQSLDQATGIALDRIGADESVARYTENPASGSVTVSDTSFTKISSKVFQGTPAPIAGSVKVNTTDASLFPASGSIYIGRGTSNYEGPLAYTSKLPPGTGGGQSGGNYWALVLSSGTLKFHNIGETVTLAQGGNRTVNAGTIVQTPQGNAVSAVQFKTLYKATLPDGEVSLDGVLVLALKPGTTGNVSAGGINAFTSAPFTGAQVTNPLPFTNGLAAESDDAYRERIRQARQSRTRGTALAIQTFTIGITSTEENKRVLSASVVTHTGSGTVVFIDDGTGYEEKSEGIAIESFIDSATGGERYFKISAPRPVTKAFVLSAEVAPFTLSAGEQLGFTVGGVTTVHTFSDDGTFRSIDNATAYEVVASINANSALNWSARTYADGTQVAVFAKENTNESIQNVAQANDANDFLGFPTGRVDTMRLYKNDRLLSKDGSLAVIVSNGVASWGTFTSSETLAIAVDGTPSVTYTFTDQDFIDNGWDASTSRILPEAWAEIFNSRIPGITATVVNGLITLTSNKGLSAGSKLVIATSTLVTKSMFAASASTGANSDYTLDRNTGEFRLATTLAVGDRLAAGSVNTRAFLESPQLGTISVSATGAHVWFVADGDTQIVQHGLTASTAMTFSVTSKAWGVRVRMTGGSALFSNVQIGDWVVFWDAASPANLKYNAYRVAAVHSGATWVEFDRSTDPAPVNPVTFSSGGVSFIRTEAPLQAAVVSTGSYTAASIAPILNAAFTGAQATIYRTQALRVATTTFEESEGDIALVAADVDGLKLGISVSDAVPNLTGHLASVETANSEIGTPDFHETVVTSATGAGDPTVYWSAEANQAMPYLGNLVVGLHPHADGATITDTRYGNNWGWVTPISAITVNGGNSYTPTLRSNPTVWFNKDRLFVANPYALAPDDSVTVLVDQDTDSKRFTVPMWRVLKTVGTTYAATNTFKDGDNGSASLAVGFGFGATGFDFNDFVVFMFARAKTHDIGTNSTQFGGALVDLNKTVLWRYYRMGADGNWARVRYTLPAAPNTAVKVGVDTYSSQYTDISIGLASGAQRTGYSLASGDIMGVSTTGPTNGLYQVYYIVQYPVTTAARAGTTVTLTLTVPSGITNSGLVNGSVYYLNSTHVDFPSGAKTLTSVGAIGGSTFNITYTEAGAANAGTPNIGAMNLGGTGNPSFAGASIALGDFVHVGSISSILTTAASYYHDQTFRLTNSVSSEPYWLRGTIEGAASASGVVSFHTVGDATALQIYVNSTQTVSTIVAAVNALAASDKRVPVTGTLIGAGSGTIDRSSSEDLNNTASWTVLLDGLNHVRTTTVPGTVVGDYQFTFKGAISASLATNSDWANEVVRIVPRTAKNLVDWLNAPTVSGLFSVSEVVRSSNARKVQIASLTPGSEGSVQVQGGAANSASAAVYGSAATIAASSQMVATVKTADLAGIISGGWVSVDNTNPLPKSVFSSTSTLQAVTLVATNQYRLQFTNANAYALTATASTSALVRVERQGNFIAIHDTGLGGTLTTTGVSEGDYIRLKTPATTTYATGGTAAAALINTGNTGVFRVVRVVLQPDHFTFGGTIWIENTAAVEQALAECDIQFLSKDTIAVGDKLSISTDVWDKIVAGVHTSNQGVYEVVDVGNNGAGSYTAAAYITITGPFNIITAPSAALGSTYQQVQIIEGKPTRLIKQVVSAAPNQSSAEYADVKFTTNKLFERVGANPGSIITALDKLAFPTSIANGLDGYQHSIGLIAEANKVLYGDPGDTATYPGVVAAGASVGTEGPLVKRIQVTLSLRIRTGAPKKDIEDRVKSAVASVINQTPVGIAIALSDLTKAAGKVGGVVSAVMVSPVALAGTELISVQPYEKPLVLNVDTDVLISFAGE